MRSKGYKPKTSPSSYDLLMKEGETPEAYYKRLAKVADQRLVRLEKLSHEKGYSAVTKYSYASAMRDISMHTPGMKRFNVKLKTYETESGETKLDLRDLRERTMSVIDFLKAPTSTRSGIDTAFKTAIDTTNKRYGSNLTWEDAAAFFEKNRHEGLFKQLKSSGTAMRAIGTIRKIEKNLADGMENALDFKMSDTVKNAAIKILSDRRRKYIAGREYNKETREAILRLLSE